MVGGIEKRDREEASGLRAGIRDWVVRTARSGRRELREAPAPVVLSLLSAAAFGPVLSAAAGLTGATAVGIGVVSSVGGGVLGEVLTGAVDRLRSHADGGVPSLEVVEAEVARAIQEVLAVEDARSLALRSDIASVLEQIDAGGAALQAAIELDNEEFHRDVVAAFAELSTDFGEMEFLLADVIRAADVIQKSLSGQGAQLRSISDQVARQSTDVRMIREDLAFIRQRTSSSTVVRNASHEDRARIWTDGCPYLGLVPFDDAHESVFYGRERLTAELMGKLAGPGPVIVTGASGAGKSSLLRAGLVPALARGVQLAGSSAWPRVIMTPTAHPLTELATHLAVLAGRDMVPLRETLADRAGEAHLIVREIMMATARHGGASVASSEAAERLVFMVDQFEQIFDPVPDSDLEPERSAFIDILCAAAKTPAGPRGEPPAVVVVAVRGDFLDRCAVYPELVQSIQRSQLVVGPMTQSELRRAIIGPAEASGLQIETALTETILSDLRSADSGHAAGILPLLSQTMMLTWENREGNRLTSRGYSQTGGVGQAIQASADAVYHSLPETQKEIAKEIFRRMTIVAADRRLQPAASSPERSLRGPPRE